MHVSMSTHKATLWLSDCGVVGHYAKSSSGNLIGSYHPWATGWKGSSTMRRSIDQLFPGSSRRIRGVVPSSSLHSHCTRTKTNNKKNKTSFAYVGNNFSWPCNNLDSCHNSLAHFCNSVHFRTTVIAGYIIAISWRNKEPLTESEHSSSCSSASSARMDTKKILWHYSATKSYISKITANSGNYTINAKQHNRSLRFRLLQQLPSHASTVSYWNITQHGYQHHTLHCPTWQTDCFLLLLLLVLWSVFVFRQHTYWRSPKKTGYLDQNQYTIWWPIQKAAGAEQTFVFIHYRGTRELRGM